MDHRELLERGFFPEPLPLAFTSADFARVSESLQHADSNGLRDKWTHPAHVNVARPNGLRRRMALVNPFKLRFLAKELESSWQEVEAHLHQSEISITQPVPLHASGPAKRGTRYLGLTPSSGSRASARSETLGGTRYTLITDISNFYGSIYTHAIDWALSGKETAKASAGKSNASLGARLDELVRNGQHGQTQGVPVGPDTSTAIAEIVLAPIDAELCRRHPRARTNARRFVDDLEFGARSYTEAEDVMHCWESTLAKFELALNPQKTKIIEGAIPPEPSWKIQLRQHPIREDSNVKLANDLRSIFSLAFEATQSNPNAAAVTYAIRRVAEIETSGVTWNELQNLLMGAMTVEPSSMRRAYEVIARSIWSGHQPQLTRFESVLNDICIHHADREHGSEVTWALYLTFRLGAHLYEETALKVLGMQDNCAVILLRSLEAAGQVDGPILDWTPVIARAEDMSCPTSEDWLLGYEFARNGWASPRAFKSLPYWQELLDLGVAFYKAPPALTPRSVSAPGADGPGPSTPRDDSKPEAPQGVPASECRPESAGDGKGAETTPDLSPSNGVKHETPSRAEVPADLDTATDQQDDDEEQITDDDPDLDLVELVSFGVVDSYPG